MLKGAGGGGGGGGGTTSFGVVLTWELEVLAILKRISTLTKMGGEGGHKQLYPVLRGEGGTKKSEPAMTIPKEICAYSVRAID